MKLLIKFKDIFHQSKYRSDTLVTGKAEPPDERVRGGQRPDPGDMVATL